MSRSAAIFDVSGRTVFITGAARGIGAASAERLHSRGANVALVGLEPDRLEQNAARLGDRAAFFEADVTELATLERAVKGTVERFGAIDVAIANAGIAFTDALATAPTEHVERTLAVNLLGVWRTDRAVIDQIVKRQGYLLNIASVSAVLHTPLMGPYTTAKAGVEALSDALRMETVPSGARVGCAYFGFIDTDLVRAAYEQPPVIRMNEISRGFLSSPAPLTRAVDAIERGIERRAARVWYPRWVGPALALRGIMQPLIERRILSQPGVLVDAMRLADPSSGQAVEQDAMLGVAAQAIAEPVTGRDAVEPRPARPAATAPADAEPAADAEPTAGAAPAGDRQA